MNDTINEQELIEAIKNDKDMIEYFSISEMYEDMKEYYWTNGILDSEEIDKSKIPFYFYYEDFDDMRNTIKVKSRFKNIKELKQQAKENLTPEKIKKVIMQYGEMYSHTINNFITNIVGLFYDISSKDDLQKLNILKDKLFNDKNYSKEYIVSAFRHRKLNGKLDYSKIDETLKKPKKNTLKRLKENIEKKIYYSTIFHEYMSLFDYFMYSTFWHEEIELTPEQIEFEAQISESIENNEIDDDYYEHEEDFNPTPEQLSLFDDSDFTDYEKKKDEYIKEKIKEIDDKLYKTETKYITYNFILELLTHDDKDLFELLRDKTEEERIKEIQESEKSLKKLEENLDTFIVAQTDKQIFFNDKVSNQLQNLENDKEYNVENFGGTTKKLKEKETLVLIKNSDSSISKPLNAFDKLVLEKIFLITRDEGKRYFDIQEIKKQMQQDDRNQRNILDEMIEESVEKMRFTEFSLTIAREIAETFKIQITDDDLDEMKKGTYLLALETNDMKKGGIKKRVYSFIKYPLFFIYEQARNQFITTDNQMLRLPLSNTPENVILKNNLAKRVQNIINNKYEPDNNLSKISYDTLLIDETEILKDYDTTSEKYKDKKKDLRKKIEKILKEWKKQNLFKDFEEYKMNGKIEGIQIIINKGKKH